MSANQGIEVTKPPETLILGVDGGGTKTACVAIAPSGEILGRGEGGPSNYQSVGVEAAETAIAQAISGALAGVSEGRIGAIGLGLAGVGRSRDLEVIRASVDRLQQRPEFGDRWQLSPDKIAIAHDCAIALTGGVGANVGVATIAGTGAIAYGRNRHGETRRSSGWGYLLGDEGSAYWIALAGLRAAVRAEDGRSPATALTEAFRQHLELDNLQSLIELVYRRGLAVKELAAYAAIVDRCARNSDAIALDILDRAADELLLATRAVFAPLFNPDEPFEVVTIGGAWKSQILRDRFCQNLHQIAPFASVIWPRHEPAYGAALLVLS